MFLCLAAGFGLLLVLGGGSEGAPVLVNTLIGAVIEYAALGLGATVVCLLRKESFASFGLKREKLPLVILLSALACMPSLLYTIAQNGAITYFPMQGPNPTEATLAAGFPTNVIGYLIIMISWGFFEGFSYVVMSDRINKLLPSKNLFLDAGAIICGVFCVLIHLTVGQPFGLGHITDFIIIYGMIVAYRRTGNAWGCVFVYMFYWNAIGAA
jgi:hypothetical protein